MLFKLLLILLSARCLDGVVDCKDYGLTVRCVGGDVSVLNSLISKAYLFVEVSYCETPAGDITHLPNLTIVSLKISHCGITSIEQTALDNLDNRTLIMDFSHNEFTTLPDFGNFEELREINFDNNLIETVGAINAYNLQVASFKRNRIAEFNFSFPNGADLRMLDLSDNNLREIPESMHYLHKLETLIISWNYISSTENFTMNQLRNFDISHNFLTALPNLVTPKLEVLKISHNRIRKVEAQAFAKIAQLGVIDLGFNILTTIPDMHGHNHINTTYLNNNQIKVIDNVTLSSNSELKIVDLSGNGIFKIEPNALINLPRLANFSLASNLIDTIDPKLLRSWKNLTVLNLQHNPWLKINEFHLLQKLEFLDVRGTQIGANEVKNLNLKFLILDYNANGKTDSHSLSVQSNWGTMAFVIHKPLTDYIFSLLKPPPNVTEPVF